MGADWGTATVGALAAIIGGVLSNSFIYGIDFRRRPRLDIDFVEGDACRVEVTHLDNANPTSFIYVRAKVRNKGHQIAKAVGHSSSLWMRCDPMEKPQKPTSTIQRYWLGPVGIFQQLMFRRESNSTWI
jgi:hypothetical protein